MLNDPVNVLLCLDRRYLIGAAVTIRSISENATGRNPIVFNVAHADLTAEDRRMLERSAPTDRDIAFRFHAVHEAAFSGLLRSKHVSRMAYARLLAGDVVDPGVSRVIYVDVDVLFLKDINELNALNLEGYLLAAVPNGSERDQAKDTDRLGLPSRTYFSSGLMVIDLDRWRREQTGTRALQYAREAGEALILHDQDALNGVLCGRFLPLPRDWCYWSATHGPESNVVIHFATSRKPWHADYDGKYRSEFFTYLDRTPFTGWRPPHWFGLAPVVFRVRRLIPYPPTVLRMTRRWIRNRLWKDQTVPNGERPDPDP